MILEALIFVFVSLLILLQWSTQSRPKGFPPGPVGIPMLGNLPFIKLPVHEGLVSLSEKYGKIFSIFLANYPVVVLTGADLIKEAFKDDRITARPALRPFLERSWGARRGILIGTGKDWQEQRRFTIKVLRDFGFGRGSMESLIKDEVVETISGFKKQEGQPIDMSTRFTAPVLNSIWHIIAGERYSHDDQRLLNLIRIIVDSFNEVQICGPIFFMDWYTKLFPDISGWNKFMSCLPPCYDFLAENIEGHQVTLDVNNPRDVIDVFLIEIQKTVDPNSSFYKDEGVKSLLVILLDLFAAGAETTSTTLTWAILYLIKNPHVQQKVQAEIDDIVGGQRLPSLHDRTRMPYMESFITETLRYSSVTPLGLMHSTSQDVVFHGFKLPKDTIVVGNFWEIHNSKKYWGDPEVFRPERFLNLDGTYRKDENVLPFSTGKRTCLGESLARDELFLFLSSLCQNFNFGIDPSRPEPSLESPLAPISKSYPYTAIVTSRNIN